MQGHSRSQNSADIDPAVIGQKIEAFICICIVQPACSRINSFSYSLQLGLCKVSMSIVIKHRKTKKLVTICKTEFLTVRCIVCTPCRIRSTLFCPGICLVKVLLVLGHITGKSQRLYSVSDFSLPELLSFIILKLCRCTSHIIVRLYLHPLPHISMRRLQLCF